MAQFLDDDTVWQQVEFLNTPGGRGSTTKLLDWVRKGQIPRPGGFGGRFKKRQWPVETAAEIYANTQLYVATGGRSTSQVRYVRELALLIENCQSPQDVLAIARGFTRGAQGQDVSAIGSEIVVWLRKKRKALRELYGKTQPDIEKRRDAYFESSDFVRLVWGLTNKFYDGYRFEGNRLIAPEKKMVAESEALKNFPKAKAA
jgi:hypothetical protein